MVIDELITEDDKPTLLRALLLRHRHVNEHSHGTFNFGLKKKYSSYSSLTVRNAIHFNSNWLSLKINFINVWDKVFLFDELFIFLKSKHGI